ncbi:BLUF domain-containing protein [Trujillonella humicola]|uniref:BLUF domain-containing protein n=1 Tax=Trujillonella humicola TaxID=3383699 RepID=UPI00390586F0
MTDTTATGGPPSLHRLLYRSHSRLDPAEREAAIADVFRVARSNNARAGITGALLLTDHWFAQVLEGPAADVQALYERIRRDPRHEDVTLIDAGEVSEPVFSRWAMAQVSASGQADIPLEAVEGHLRTATGEPLTREQAALLRIMRGSIGADVV